MDLSGRAKAVGGEPRLPYRLERRPTEPRPTVAAPPSHVYWRRHPRRRQLSLRARGIAPVRRYGGLGSRRSMAARGRSTATHIRGAGPGPFRDRVFRTFRLSVKDYGRRVDLLCSDRVITLNRRIGDTHDSPSQIVAMVCSRVNPSTLPDPSLGMGPSALEYGSRASVAHRFADGVDHPGILIESHDCGHP